MAIEIRTEQLEKKEREAFEKCHEDYDSKNDKSRKIHGWYSKENIRIVFYYTPSWFSRQKMYWMHGWKWEYKKDA